ncbi:hypothetical protein AL073_01570 [Loktanella sp. 1ANDIMAR09]|nr:hypothetical protein AL073_01570 [Loktanella sp. 1ANDIMAR09]
MTGNLGETGLKRKRRRQDPMRAYDALPPALRGWLADAALPWSPVSCRRIWQRARARGEPIEAVLARLERAQAQTLAKDPIWRASRAGQERGYNRITQLDWKP